MRLRWILPCAFLLLAQPASASPFVATLSILVLGGQLLFTGSGNGFNTQASVTLPGGTFSGTQSAPIPGASASAMAIAKLAPIGPGAFSGTPLEGPMPVRGVLRLESKIGGYADLPLNSGYDLKAFGVGGVLTYTFPKPPIGGPLKLYFAPWVAGPATLPKGGGTYTGPTMFTGSDARTPGGMGQITFVSPSKIVVDTDATAMLGVLVVEFVPEPGAPLLLGTGAALLCAFGARRGAKPREG
jgi:hypothetical protein